MKFIALGVAALATVLTVLPASAQMENRERGDSARVTVNEGHHEGWRRSHAECRVVKVRKHVGNHWIVSTRRTCG